MTIIAQPHVVVLDGYRYPVVRTLAMSRAPTVGKRWWFRRAGRAGRQRLYSRLERHEFSGAIPVVIERVDRPGGWDADWFQLGWTIYLRHPRTRS